MIQSSFSRLTVIQKSIFSAVLDYFGEDMKENFIFLLTFADGEEPLLVPTLEDSSSLFNNLIPYIKKPWYYKFNNSFIFESDRKCEFTNSFFKLCMKSFEEFTQRLVKLPKKSLNQTKKVLEERNKLEKSSELLFVKLKELLNKMDYTKDLIQKIQKLKNVINDSKNYYVVTKIPKPRRVPTLPGHLSVHCLNCNSICLKNCRISNDGDKNKCECFKNDFCTICRLKCHWREHKCLPYFIEFYNEEETIILEELKRKYDDSKSQLDKIISLLIKEKSKLIILNNECINIQDSIKNSINKLQQITLNKIDFEEIDSIIELLINDEKERKNIGWQERIEELKSLREKKILLKEIYKGENQKMEQISKFIEESLNKEMQ